MQGNVQLKAIETIYRGYRFRSRLEARWAVFFDTLDIKWEYEKEGYDLAGVWYLPDFWLPEHQRWIEIKGKDPTQEELRKLELLRDCTGYPSIIFYGEPGKNWGYAEYSDVNDSGGGNNTADRVDWAICSTCGKVDLNLRYRNDQVLVNEEEEWRSVDYCTCKPIAYNPNHPRIKAAYIKAKQARFERGGA